VNVLVVGLSHHTAPVALLERVSAAAVGLPDLLRAVLGAEAVGEAFALSTCNRVEVYAGVERFHAAVTAISELLAERADVPLGELTDHLYVRYEDAAASHLFTVAAGLDSMVVGEAQILGQIRTAYAVAREHGVMGATLHELVQSALRAGKRVHTETGIDAAGASLVGAGLALGEVALGPLAGRPALIVGAGSMAALVGATLRRAGAGSIVVANRSSDNAARLGAALSARATSLADLPGELTAADVVVCSTGATGVVLPVEVVAAAVAARQGRPLVVLDLALPHDVDPAVAALPGVTLVDLERLRGVLEGAGAGEELDAARRIVAAEVVAFLAWQRSVRVAPTVAALRSRAAEVVDSELNRLTTRLPALDPAARAEVESAVRRVVDKLLHAPTVRVKELAGAEGGDSYAAALRELFGLHPVAASTANGAPLGRDPSVAVERSALLEPAPQERPLERPATVEIRP